MSLVLFDSEAAEAAPAAISCFERIIVVGISLTFELSATSSSNSTMYAKGQVGCEVSNLGVKPSLCKYPQSPLIRTTAKLLTLGVLKNSLNLDAHRFLILQI